MRPCLPDRPRQFGVLLTAPDPDDGASESRVPSPEAVGRVVAPSVVGSTDPSVVGDGRVAGGVLGLVDVSFDPGSPDSGLRSIRGSELPLLGVSVPVPVPGDVESLDSEPDDGPLGVAGDVPGRGPVAGDGSAPPSVAGDCGAAVPFRSGAPGSVGCPGGVSATFAVRKSDCWSK